MSDTAWTVNQGGASGSTGNGVASPGHTGTEGSNPSPSSGGSSANLTGPRGAAHRRSDRDCPLVMPSGQRDRGRGVAGFGWGTIIAPDTEICPNHGIPFRRMSFHEAIAFRIYRIRPRADQNRPLPISVPKIAIFLVARVRVVRSWDMRKGIVVDVTATDRARLETVVANRNSPHQLARGISTSCAVVNAK